MNEKYDTAQIYRRRIFFYRYYQRLCPSVMGRKIPAIETQTLTETPLVNVREQSRQLTDGITDGNSVANTVGSIDGKSVSNFPTNVLWIFRWSVPQKHVTKFILSVSYVANFDSISVGNIRRYLAFFLL